MNKVRLSLLTAIFIATAFTLAEASTNADYSPALQTYFEKGTLGSPGKTRPIEMFFQKVSKSGNSYSVSGKSKTTAAEDAFSGTLTISSAAAGGSCASGETEIKGSYDLKEKDSKTSGRFVGTFTACEKSGYLSKADFKGNWVKDANGNKTPCDFATVVKIKEMEPRLGEELNFSEEGEAEFQKAWDAAMKVEWDKLPKNQQKILEKNGYDETFGSDSRTYWEVFDRIHRSHSETCNWYCGGDHATISASSYLKSNSKTIDYLPKNIHDGSYKTAWVPGEKGAKGYGIGEYVTYNFNRATPAIIGIIVANGYVKSEKAYRDNSRVKKLKMYIDNKPVAILNLKDVRREQIFKFESIGGTGNLPELEGLGGFYSEGFQKKLNELSKQPGLTMKFEILEVYKGDKYDDTPITQIYFDGGITGLCFAAGTKILMKDNSQKNIESIKEGDWVKSYDFKNKKLIDSKVTKLASAPHSNLLKLKFAGNEIVATTDHPFWIEKGVWAAADAEKANRDYVQKAKVEKLKIGDKVFMPEKNVFMEIIGMETIDKQQTTYTIELSEGDNFIANGMLVKTEVIGGSLH